MYDVIELLDDLEGHELTRTIKIKLADGSIHEIAGVEFRNACIGGDDIIYIKEKNPLKIKYEKDIRTFLSFAKKIFDVCEEEYCKNLENDEFDGVEILSIEIELAKQCDFYIRKCKLEKDVEKMIGFFEPGCGSADELSAKICVLECFIN